MEISAIALRGLEQAQTLFDRSARRRAEGSGELPSDVVDLMAAKAGTQTAVRVTEVADEMERRALDVMG